MGMDAPDRTKIRQRTRPLPAPDYDYRLDLVEEEAEGPVAFLVLGDAGSRGRRHRAKYRVAEVMAREEGIDLVLHLGDVVYSSGSKEGYRDRFIRAYHRWLLRGEGHVYDDMVFTKPVLPVYGNHDYYDLQEIISVPAVGKLLRGLIGEVLDEIGSGSKNGRVFEEAFVESDLSRVERGRLPYATGRRTRIPNRYYWFTHGPCAFFALDSNTLDGVDAPSAGRKAELDRRLGEARKEADLRRRQYDLVTRHIRERGVKEGIEGISLEEVEATLYDVIIRLADAEKEVALLEKRLRATREDFDAAQLAWLDRVLGHEDVRGKWKIVYLHHPLYSSDGSHTDDPESGGLRENLRRLFVAHGVHLVLSGHSHCFEWLKRARPADGEEDALAEAERRICYLVSGGGGRQLRRSILEEDSSDVGVLKKQRQFLGVAESGAYTAILGENEKVYHYLRVDAGESRLRVTPVGVVDGGKAGAVRESPMRTLVLTKDGDEIRADPRRLAAIDVFRDRAPEAGFAV